MHFISPSLSHSRSTTDEKTISSTYSFHQFRTEHPLFILYFRSHLVWAQLFPHSATQTEGIFRVSGSNKRINQLQIVFDEPPRYGKDFDWTGYSVHDAASVLRRYLNSLPVRPVSPSLFPCTHASLEERVTDLAVRESIGTCDSCWIIPRFYRCPS